MVRGAGQPWQPYQDLGMAEGAKPGRFELG